MSAFGVALFIFIGVFQAFLQIGQVGGSGVIGQRRFPFFVLLEKGFLLLGILALEVLGDREDDLSPFPVELDHGQRQFVAFVERFLGTLEVTASQMLQRDETLHIAGQIHDHALVDQAADDTGRFGSRIELFGQIVPRVGRGLLVPERDPALFLVDAQHDDLDLVPLLDQFAGMPDPLGPGEIADMDQTVDSGLDLDESAEIGQIAHFAAEFGPDREAYFEGFPRIGFGLLQPQRDLLVLGVDPQDHHFDLVADVDELGGVPDVLGP